MSQTVVNLIGFTPVKNDLKNEKKKNTLGYIKTKLCKKEGEIQNVYRIDNDSNHKLLRKKN